MGRGLRVREIDLFKIRQQCGSNFGVRSGFFYPRAQNSLYTSVLRAYTYRTIGAARCSCWVALGKLLSFPLYKLKY